MKSEELAAAITGRLRVIENVLKDRDAKGLTGAAADIIEARLSGQEYAYKEVLGLLGPLSASSLTEGPMVDTATISQHRGLGSYPITLDGENAILAGYCNPFATVVGLSSGKQYAWSWATVERVILKKGGAFKS